MIRHLQDTHLASSNKYPAISYVSGSNSTVSLKSVEPQQGHTGDGIPLISIMVIQPYGFVVDKPCSLRIRICLT